MSDRDLRLERAIALGVALRSRRRRRLLIGLATATGVLLVPLALLRDGADGDTVQASEHSSTSTEGFSLPTRRGQIPGPTSSSTPTSGSSSTAGGPSTATTTPVGPTSTASVPTSAAGATTTKAPTPVPTTQRPGSSTSTTTTVAAPTVTVATPRHIDVALRSAVRVSTMRVQGRQPCWAQVRVGGGAPTHHALSVDAARPKDLSFVVPARPGPFTVEVRVRSGAAGAGGCGSAADGSDVRTPSDVTTSVTLTAAAHPGTVRSTTTVAGPQSGSGDWSAFQRAIDSARARWSEYRKTHAVAYRAERVCSCGDVAPAFVTANAQATSHRVEDYFGRSEAVARDPIDVLFATLQGLVDGDVASLEVTFADESGIPVAYEVDQVADLVDDESSWAMLWLQTG